MSMCIPKPNSAVAPPGFTATYSTHRKQRRRGDPRRKPEGTGFQSRLRLPWYESPPAPHGPGAGCPPPAAWSWTGHQDAERAAWAVPGVTAVRNDLEIVVQELAGV